MHMLHQELQKLQSQLVEISALVNDNLEAAYQAYTSLDFDLAAIVVEKDLDIDRYEVEIEEECLKLLALYQPVANDLRFIIAFLKVNNDLERIADQAKSIGKAIGFMRHIPEVGKLRLPSLSGIYRKAVEMFAKSLEAMSNLDVDLARQVCAEDEEINEMVWESIRFTLEEMKSNPSTVEVYMHVMNIARRFERVADHATNIAEDAIYMKEGEIVRHHLWY